MNTAALQNQIETALSDIQAEVLPINLDDTYTIIHEGEVIEKATLKQILAYLEEGHELRVNDYYEDPCGLRFEVKAFNDLINDWEDQEDIIAYSKPKKMSDVLNSYGVAA